MKKSAVKFKHLWFENHTYLTSMTSPETSPTMTEVVADELSNKTVPKIPNINPTMGLDKRCTSENTLVAYLPVNKFPAEPRISNEQKKK